MLLVLLLQMAFWKKEEENLLARFTKVFEQTYTRFLDLQKAEEQARESKIETALEPKFQDYFVDAMAFPNKRDPFPNLFSQKGVQMYKILLILKCLRGFILKKERERRIDNC